MNEFENLVAELEGFAKSTTADTTDATIRAAAPEGAASTPEKPEGEEDEGDTVVKALTVTLPDGTTQEAFDASDMLKALGDDVTALGGQNTILVKGMRQLIGRLAQQDTIIKSLRADVEKLGQSGRGRVPTLTAAQKQAPTAAAGGGAIEMSAGELMTKALTAFQGGKISSTDLTTLEVNVGFVGNAGALPMHVKPIVDRVLGH